MKKANRRLIFILIIILITTIYMSICLNNVYATSLGTILEDDCSILWSNSTGSAWSLGTVYDNVGNMYPPTSIYDQSDGTDNYFDFWINGGGEPGTLSQDITINGLDSLIDTNGIGVEARANLYRFHKFDEATMELEFYNSSNVKISGGPYTVSNDSKIGDEWQDKLLDIPMPAGTRKIKVILKAVTSMSGWVDFDGIRVVLKQLNRVPSITISNPTTNQLLNDSGTISISGTASDYDGDSVTVSATINGKTIQTTASSGNWTLNWNINSLGITEGTYPGIVITADDGKGGNSTATYMGNITVDKTAPTVTITPASTAGGDALVNSAEKTAGFNVVARSSEATGTLYVVPSGTANNIGAITGAAVGSASSAGANADTTIAISAGNAGIIDATSYRVYAVDGAGNISIISGTAFTVDLTVPSNQNTVFSTNVRKSGGSTVAILSANETGGAVWFAPSGKTLVSQFTAGSTMTTAGGTVTSILAPADNGTYYLYVIDAAGNVSAASTATLTVDNSAPTVASINRNSPAGPWTNASSVIYQVTFSKNVNGVDIDDFKLTSTGTASGSIASVSASTGTTINVTVNSVSGNGTLRLDLNSSGTGITDDASNPISGGFTGGQTYSIDTTAPNVSSVAVPLNATYVTGQNLDFTVNFSEPVTVVTTGGTPYIPINLNTGGTVHAAYQSGSGTSALVFRYTVASGNNDDDGVTLGAAITANGGTLRDAAGNDGVLTLNSVGSTAGVLVDTIAPTVSSVGVPSNGTYATGQNLDFTVNFSEPVTVVTTGGTPYIPITLNTGGTVHAAYHNGSGTTALVFRYTVASGNNDNDGVTVGAAISANGGTLKDSIGNEAVLTLNNIGITSGVLVDALAPTVSLVSSSTANGAYKAGDVIAVTVTFSEPVTVTGTPTLALNSGGTASYTSGSNTATLTFNYIVGGGQNSLDLDYSATNSLALAGGFIKDGAGNNATLTLPAVGGANSLGNQKNIVVDTTAPNVSTVAVPSNGTYATGQNLDFTVNFSEPVTVVTAGGTPYIPITLNTGGTVHAAYLNGSGTTALVFRYTVASGNNDNDGITVGVAILANGGILKDTAGNDGVLTLNSIGSTAGVLVDGIAPTVSSVGVPSNKTYATGQNLDFTVNFSEPVTVVTTGGTPYIPITLNTGGIVHAAYQSGSGTTALMFRYTVASGNNDNDGVTVGTAITSNGGTLKDTAGNDATLTLTGHIPSTAGVMVDGIAPSVSSINRQTPAGASTNAASVVYRVTFSENVSNVGTDDFTLTHTGSATGSINSISGSGMTYDVTVNSINGTGTLRLDLNNSGTGIVDDATNPISSGFTTGQTYTIDRDAPSVSIIKPGSLENFGAGSILIATITDAGSGINPSSIEVRLNGDLSNGSNKITGNTLYHVFKLSDIKSLINGDTYTVELKVSDNAGNTTTATVSIHWNNYRRGFGFGRFTF